MLGNGGGGMNGSEITGNDLKGLMAGHETVVLLDVREEGEFAKAHIPGSILVPLDRLVDHCSFWPTDSLMVIICNTRNRSAAAARMLKKKGFTRVYYVSSGVKDWEGPLQSSICPQLSAGSLRGNRIYLDHAATTPVEPEVCSTVSWAITQGYGNPSSSHTTGRISRDLMNRARECVAQLIGAKSEEIIFTSGGTEANNTALWGILRSLPPKKRRLITSSVEHMAILDMVGELEYWGYPVTVLSVNRYGMVEP